jgi:hypothetical protein
VLIRGQLLAFFGENGGAAGKSAGVSRSRPNLEPLGAGDWQDRHWGRNAEREDRANDKRAFGGKSHTDVRSPGLAIDVGVEGPFSSQLKNTIASMAFSSP